MKPIVLHFVVRHSKGKIVTDPVVGSDGTVIREGGRYVVACQPWRKDFGRIRRVKGKYAGEGDHIRCTGDPNVVTCKECRATKLWIHASTPRPGAVEQMQKVGR